MDSASGASRKRTLTHSRPSSPTTSKHPRRSPPSEPRSSLPPLCTNDPASALAHKPTTPRVCPSEAASSSSSSSSSSCARTNSDPFPRYELGIPHLDVLLPFRDGLDLLHAYHHGVGWINTPVDRTTLLETLEEAERHGATSIHPHRLACLLAALALGELFAPCFPSSIPSSSRHAAHSSSKRGRIWFGVASACLAGSRSDVDLMHSPTPDACSALYLMSIYLLCSNDDELFQRSHGLTGLALILAKAALVPSCLPSSRNTSPPNLTTSASSHANLSVPWQPVPANTTHAADHDRLQCNRLLSDLIFHLQCQILTLALPCTTSLNATKTPASSLANLPDVPTIQAIWTAFGTPLYASIDAFGNRYSPNIFHNWKLGLADLMHQVSSLTNQIAAADIAASSAATQHAKRGHEGSLSAVVTPTLPEHAQIIKLDERIRRYQASLPDFLLLHRPLPVEMAGKVDEDELAQIICQRHMACSIVHRMLMALHRPWFLSALANKSGPPLATGKSKAGPDERAAEPAEASIEVGQPSASCMYSLSAVLRSATWQTETFASATACAPPQALAWWQFTNNALAAAVVQATALLRLCGSSQAAAEAAPAHEAERSTSTSQFHRQVRTDLDKNVCSFQNVAKRCKLAARALPFLQRVCAAIDTGRCKSKPQPALATDALQTSPMTEVVTNAPGQVDVCGLGSKDKEPAASQFNSPMHLNISTSIRDSISNPQSRTFSSNSHGRLDATERETRKERDEVASGRSSSWHSASGDDEAWGGERRASSANSRAGSELEAIFGPIAEGLEPADSAAAAPRTAAGQAKPFYRQNWDSIPVTRVEQPPPHSDAGSSSSGTMPITPAATPGSRSPRIDAGTLPDVQGTPNCVRADQGAAEAASGKKKASFESDLVLQCIRFWQPDLAPTPPRSALATTNP